MWQIYYRILISAGKTFGLGLIFWRWLLFLPLFLGFTHFTLFLDKIFFSQYQKVKIKNPVFIIGNPRSGTSFLHNLLTQTDDFVAFKTWEIFFPALTARVLVKPIINYLIRHNLTKIMHESSGHGLYLDRVEHDEFLFIHKLDTQFLLLLSPLGLDDREYPELRLYDRQSDARRYSSVKFFQECLKRQIYYSKKEKIIAHIHFSTGRIKTLLETFPDAKFIYLVRSPQETIPSHLTLEYNTFKNQKRLDNIPKNRLKRYFKRRYLYDIELYRYFFELQQKAEILSKNLMVLPYNLLCSNLEKSFNQIENFTGIKSSDELRQAVKKQAGKQKQYRRQHRIIKLQKFGLSRKQIAEDFDFVFKEYNLEQNYQSNVTT
ncbi:Sulfotransferase family protein [Hyella patelloides LEGE 07179]|uniref:Sulfotransferase family protein n=1 Tax=Hyella patelloides LEGE 07179 TaxID=945734 RepID=A0A563VKS2_9CYAN|nr:sulfotransferase [Hyella patelloides]VEP11905.1 Sulfotransferase family protein [Hyella patelloides LEGE 07179]